MIAFKGGRRGVSGRPTGLSRDFGKLVSYLTRSSPHRLNPDRVAWISRRNLDGADDPARAAQIMRAQAGENPLVERPVYHFGLSIHPADHLSRDQWDQAVDRVLDSLGLGHNQVLVVAHGDTDHEHVHAVVNRVGDDGRAWIRRNDRIKMRDTVRRLEIEYGLTRHSTHERCLPGLTPGAYLEALHTGRRPLADRVRDQAAAFAEAGGWSDLEARLAGRGFRLQAAARKPGLLVTDGSRFAALSRVDPALSGPQLARRFGETFDEHRRTHPEPPALRLAERAAEPRPGATLETRAAALLDRLVETRATFSAADLRRAAFCEPDRADLVSAARRSPRVLDLGADARGITRYTTREYLDAEARLLAAAANLSSRHQLRLDAAAPAVAPGPAPGAPALAPPALAPAAGDRATPGLTAEQRAAVLHATTGPDLAQIAGGGLGPGDGSAGSTAAARTIAAIYQERGYEVRGAALTVNAAAALQATTGAQSRPLAALERAWSEGAERLHPRAVLLLDQAGLLDVRQLGRILAAVEERGAKVVLLGDRDRLEAIGPGAAWRGLLEQFPSAHLGVDAAADSGRRQLAAGRETFPILERAEQPFFGPGSSGLAGHRAGSAIDQPLPRHGYKDLAGDYAAAELRRAAARLQDLAARTRQATLEELPLREALAALSTLRDARLRTVESRRAVARAADQVYADPPAALHGLLRDPAAPDRLRQGKARLYGRLRGRAGLGSLGRERAGARHAVASLTGCLEAHRRNVTGLDAAKQAARARTRPLAGPALQPERQPPAISHEVPGAAGAATRALPARPPRPAQIRRELARVTAVLRHCRQASRGAQDAIETAIRGMGRATLDSALLLLPPQAALPVRAAVRAVSRVFDRGLDRGR